MTRAELWSAGQLVYVETRSLDGGYTRHDAAGNVLEQRALTADEIAALTPPPPTAAELLRAEIAALPAPTMPADVLDVLDRALALLDGA